MTIGRYTKTGRGARLGTRWEDARPFADLQDDLLTASSGDLLLIGFDRNREDPLFWSDTALTIRSSGSASGPLEIKAGYIAHADDVQLIQAPNRESFFRRSGYAGIKPGKPDLSGDPFIVLNDNASFLVLSGFACFGAPASGLIRIGRGDAAVAHTDISIRDINVTLAGRVIETSQNASIERLIVEDCTASEIERGFARFRTLSDAVFRNLFLDAGYVDGTGVNVCQLIHVIAGHDLLFENIWMRSAVNGLAAEERGSPYVQGDGIVCEEETRDVIFRNCHATGMGDGGFDLKSLNVLFEDGSAHGCKKGVRIWSRGENLIRRSHITSPRKTGRDRGSCIWCAGAVDIVDTSLQAGSGAAIFAFGERLPHIRMFGGEIRIEADAALIAEEPGVLELHDVAVNGTIRNETVQSRGGIVMLP